MPYTAQVVYAAPAEVQTGLRRAMPALDYAVLLETGRAHGAFREELDRYDWLAAGGAHKVHRLATATADDWSNFSAAWRCHAAAGSSIAVKFICSFIASSRAK